MARNLTAKQLIFANAFLETLDGTEAARRAYKAKNDNTFGVIAYENLRKPKIKAYIDERLKEKTMSADEVLYRLTQEAQYIDTVELSKIETIVEIAPDGTEITRPILIVDLEKIKARGLGKMVKKIRMTAQGNIEIEWIDSQKALELLGKYHGLFTERIEHTGEIKVDDSRYDRSISSLVDALRESLSGPAPEQENPMDAAE